MGYTAYIDRCKHFFINIAIFHFFFSVELAKTEMHAVINAGKITSFELL